MDEITRVALKHMTDSASNTETAKAGGLGPSIIVLHK